MNKMNKKFCIVFVLLKVFNALINIGKAFMCRVFLSKSNI